MRKQTTVQQIVSVVTVLAFVNCLAGCSSIVNVPKDELAELPQADSTKSEWTRLHKSRIIAATLHSGEVIDFDDWGARLNTTAKTVSGVTKDGRPVGLKYDDVFYLKVEDSDSAIKNLDPKSLELAGEVQSQEKIVAVVLNSGDVINFDNQGGRFDEGRRIVTGKSWNGSPVAIGLDEIANVRAKRISATKTLLYFGVGAAVSLLILYAIFSSWEMDVDLGEGGFFPPGDE